MSNIQNAPLGGKAVEVLPVARERREYSAPQLFVFGAVSQLTRGTATVGEDGANTRMNKQSDRAFKQNIVQVGVHPLGIGLYLFEYKPEFQASAGFGRQFGVMADEVEAVMPEAVSLRPDGFKQVDYTLLGISREIH